MATDSGDEFTVTVKRNVAFSRERVFAAWTDPLSVESWFAPGGMDARGVEMDVRTGGVIPDRNAEPQRRNGLRRGRISRTIPTRAPGIYVDLGRR